ncbi:hypothetical protein B296_00031707 [Ensete ventricosum]|uniref:Uncharacterized protein n=1 Tax=Ensete ventricosum TaxID=4639 RepID=A0A426X4N6_ENSVE|nr:hypothetical protein B296_00031707 [Ensete ventricosum]
MHRIDAFGNLPGVCRKLAEGIESLPGWRKGVRQKKTETRRKIVGGSRKAYRDSDDVVGSHRKFARRFTEGIGKLTGNVKGDRQKEDRRTYRKITGVAEVYGRFDLHPKKIGSGCRCASRRRTRKWT